MLAAKMDLLMKKLESPHQEVNPVSESRMTCETCGETGHSGNSCPLTQEDANFVRSNNNPNSGFHPQQGWNSKPNLPFGQQQGMNFNNNFQHTLVYGQKQINDNNSKKFLANDKILESMAAQCWRLPTSPSDDARRRQFGTAVFHEPRIDPQVHGIPL